MKQIITSLQQHWKDNRRQFIQDALSTILIFAFGYALIFAASI
jgi:uncharacterized membrane protein